MYLVFHLCLNELPLIPELTAMLVEQHGPHECHFHASSDTLKAKWLGTSHQFYGKTQQCTTERLSIRNEVLVKTVKLCKRSRTKTNWSPDHLQTLGMIILMQNAKAVPFSIAQDSLVGQTPNVLR